MNPHRWLRLSVVCVSIGATCPLVWAQPQVKREFGPLLNPNGGFEDGKGQYYFTRPTQSFMDNDEVYRGQAALRLQGEGTPGASEANIAVQGFAIPTPKPTTHYLLKVAVKARGVDAKFAPSVQFRREDPRKNVTVMEREKGVIGTDTDWRVLEFDSGPLPADAKTLSFWLHLPSQSKATVWFDEIEVREILNPPANPAALAAAPPQVQTIAAPTVAPKPAEAPKPAALTTQPLGWNLAVNHGNLSLYEKGDAAFATLTWNGNGPAPAVPLFALFDQNDRQLRPLPAEASAGGWRLNLPTDRLGYFEVRPLAANADAVLPALGSRPAGRLTFAVVDKVDPNPSHDFTTAFLSTQGTTIIQQDKPGFGWDMLPLMGVQAQGVGYQWSRFEADGPGTFEKNIAGDRQPEWVRQMKIMPYFHLNGAPMWAVDASRLPEKERKGASTQRVPPKDWNQWEAYLEKLIPYLVKKYDFLPQRTYEVMWEPVIPWGWYGTPEEIVKNFEIAHRVIRKYDPKGRVAGPTLSGLNDTAYYETLLKAGLGQYLDVVAFHPYKGYPPEKNAIPEALRNIRELTKKYSGRDLPFIGTEFGFPQANAGSALNQGYGLTASLLIFKGEGARQHTLFYMADYAGEPGYGMNYNLVAGLPFGPSKISPKPGVPMIRAAIEQVGNAEPVGKLDYLGADIWGYVFKDNADGTLLAAVWDSSDRNRTIQLETGVPRVTTVDCFDNTETKTTQDGRLTLQLGRAPIYIRGLSSQLYGPGRLEPLLNTGEVWKVYRGRATTQKLGFNRDLGGPNATLTFDTAADVSAEQLRQPVSVRRGQNTALTFNVSATAPLGPAAANLRLRDGDNTLYRGVQRLEVAPELEIQPPSARRHGAAWAVESQLKNVSPFPWEGTATLQLAGGAPQQRNISLAPGAATVISFPVAGGNPTETVDASLNLLSKQNARLAQTGRLSFFEIGRRPEGTDFWAKLPAVEVPGTPQTIWKQHPDSQFKGPDDLSFKAGYAYDDLNLYVQVVVRDDVHRQVASPGTTWSQDNVQLAFDMAPGRGENANLVAEGFERTRSEWSLAFTPRGPEIFLNTAPGGTLVPESQVVTYPGAKLEGGRQEGQTVYRLTLPWKLLDPRGVRDKSRLGLAAAVNDSDADTPFGDRRGLELFGGILRSKDTAQFGVAQLQP